MYYKILLNSTLIKITNKIKWLIWDNVINTFVESDKKNAEAIEIDNEIFYINKMPQSKYFDYPIFPVVEVVSISIEDYNYLKNSTLYRTINSNELTTAHKDAILNETINNFSLKCEQSIYNGIDIQLSDTLIHHFSLELPDQLAITNAYNRVLKGEDEICLHADNEPYRIFSANEIIRIYNAMTYKIQYETMYFNSLKIWLKSFIRAEDIIKIHYGDTIPLGFQTEAFKRLQLQR